MSERRRYPRIQADVLCRPAGIELFHHRRSPRDLSLGGMRVHSDDRFRVGDRLDIDVLAPDGDPVRCWGIVVWVTELPADDPARFDIGLRFTDMSEPDLQRLATLLGPRL